MSETKRPTPGMWVKCTKAYSTLFEKGEWCEIAAAGKTLFSIPHPAGVQHFVWDTQHFDTTTARLKPPAVIPDTKVEPTIINSVEDAKRTYKTIDIPPTFSVPETRSCASCGSPHEGICDTHNWPDGKPFAFAGTENVLQQAEKLIYGDRQRAYGSVSTNFANIAKGWSVILGTEVSAEQVGLCMAWLKIARQVNKPNIDNLIDAAGYVGCVEKVQKGL